MILKLLTFCILATSIGISQNVDGMDSRQRIEAQDQVAAMVNSIRSAAGLKRLSRRRPSIEDVQLTCSSAQKDKRLNDPKFGIYASYKTKELSAEDPVLRSMALGVVSATADHLGYDLAFHNWNQFSVVVYRSSNLESGKSVYWVGIARHSILQEFIGSLGFDNPIKDRNDWKNQISSTCKNEKP